MVFYQILTIKTVIHTVENTCKDTYENTGNSHLIYSSNSAIMAHFCTTRT